MISTVIIPNEMAFRATFNGLSFQSKRLAIGTLARDEYQPKANMKGEFSYLLIYTSFGFTHKLNLELRDQTMPLFFQM